MQGLEEAPSAQASEPFPTDSAQPVKAYPPDAVAVSVAADRTLTATSVDSPAATVTASAPSTSTSTEPLGPAAAVRVR